MDGVNLVASIKNPWGGKMDLEWQTKGAAGSKYDESSAW